MVGGRVVQMDREAGKRLFADNEVDVFLITAQPEMLASVESQLRQFCKEHGLLLHSFADLRRRLDGMTNSIIGAFWGLLGLGFVVVAFAIANTLTMNVLEQTRDLALLRVVAMTRHQVRKTILAQAVIIGSVAIALGLVVGMCGSCTTNLCSYAELGHTVPFAMHPGLLVTTFFVTLTLVVVVAWLPAVALALDLLIALRTGGNDARAVHTSPSRRLIAPMTYLIGVDLGSTNPKAVATTPPATRSPGRPRPSDRVNPYPGIDWAIWRRSLGTALPECLREVVAQLPDPPPSLRRRHRHGHGRCRSTKTAAGFIR
jgi:hypothetical protein